MTTDSRIKALEKLAFGLEPTPANPNVGLYNPPQTVGNVLSSIGFAQAHDIGTQSDRLDAFGRIIDSGLEATSPAGKALGMIRGGMLGRFIASAVTDKPFLKGLGTGIGAVLGRQSW